MQIAPAISRPGRKLLKNVEIFYSGTHVDSEGNTYTYTDDDISQAVANFPLLSRGDRPVLRPPVGVGHDSAKAIPDELLSDAALAAGDVVGLTEGEIEVEGQPRAALFADIEVDGTVADWVEAGYLTRVSAEVLDEPPPEGASLGASGKTLRRVALLGFTPPSLKFLRPLPRPVPVATYSDRRFLGKTTARRGNGVKRSVAFFCDVCRTPIQGQAKFQGGTPMTRDEMLAWLQKNGTDTSLLADPAIPDAVIQLLYDTAKQLADLTAGAPPGGQPPPVGMSDSQGQGGTPKQVTLKYSDPEFQAALTTAVNRIVGPLKAQFEVDRRNGQSLAVQERQRQVKSFCEQMRIEKRLAPADLDCDPKTGVPLPETVYARLLRMTNHPTVHKFSDSAGKVVEKTELEIQMDEIRSRAPRNFSERIPGQKAGGALAAPKTPIEAARERANAYADSRLAQLGRKVG